MKLFYIVGLAAVVGCASGGHTGGGGGGAPPADRNVITESEIMSVPSASLYDLIEKLRPHFVR